MWQVLKYELFRGLAYRSIEHANARLYTTWLPLALAGAFLVGFYALPVKPPLLGKDGAFASALSILSTLPGFYFAGLAAIATFTNPTIDQEMQAPAPELKLLIAGREAMKPLTRRQFLCYLFSYLVIISFVLCFELLILNAAVGSVAQGRMMVEAWSHGATIWGTVKGLALAQIAALTASLLATTLHGVFFLTERIHQP